MKARNASHAILLVGVDNRLSVAVRAEDVALRQQRRTQRLIVPDLTIEGDPDVAALIGHRLVSASQIDDAKPRDAQADLPVEVYPTIVRPSMGEHSRHALDNIWRDWFSALGVADATDATHRPSPPISR